MLSPEDSLVSPAKGSRLKSAAVVTMIAALAAGAWWVFGRGTGEPEDPARVLVIGPSPDLAEYLQDEGFDADHLSFGAAVGEGQSLDAKLDDLAAVVEFADQSGYGFVALDLGYGQDYAFADAGYEAPEAPEAPPGTRFVVVSVGDLGRHVSVGGVPPEVFHEPRTREQVGVLLALFGQPELDETRLHVNNDLMIRFGSAGTLEDLAEIELAHTGMREQIAAWNALADRERSKTKPIELAHPYEPLSGWGLANGEILLGSASGAWRSSDGRETHWDLDASRPELSVVALTQPEQRRTCASLPDALELDGFHLAAAGDALLIPSSRYVAELWTLRGDGCGFEHQAEIRRLDGGELGEPRATASKLGRTVASQDGRLSWADAKMRAARNASFAGVELRPGLPTWVSDDVVAIAARLDFQAAAEDQRRRAHEARVQAALEAGLPAPELPPITEDPEFDPGTLPADRDAVVFIRLPGPTSPADAIELVVIPIDALNPETLLLRDVSVIADQPWTVAVHVELRTGSQLLRLSLDPERAAWRAGLAADYVLADAVEAGRATAQVAPLAHELPGNAQGLVVSPTGRHAAWSAPAGDPPPDSVDGNLEIFVLALGPTLSEPIQLTHNGRRDWDPHFVGPDAGYVLFMSNYPTDDPANEPADDELPAIDTLRALPLP